MSSSVFTKSLSNWLSFLSSVAKDNKDGHGPGGGGGGGREVFVVASAFIFLNIFVQDCRLILIHEFNELGLGDKGNWNLT